MLDGAYRTGSRAAKTSLVIEIDRGCKPRVFQPVRARSLQEYMIITTTFSRYFLRIAMFSSTLKLFSQVACPDENCTRSPCLFSHHEQHRTAPSQANSTSNRSTVAVPPSRAPPAKPQNAFINRNTSQRLVRPVTISRTPASASAPRTEQSAAPVASRTEPSITPITAFDMARGLTAQSSKTTSKTTSSASSRGAGTPNSATSSIGPSRAPPVPLQTKTTTSGMIKRPNKRPTAVCI